MWGGSWASMGWPGGGTGRFTYEVWSAAQAPVTGLGEPVGPGELGDLFVLGDVAAPPPPPPPEKPPNAAPPMTILVAVEVPSAVRDPVTGPAPPGAGSLSGPGAGFGTPGGGGGAMGTAEPAAGRG